MLKKKIQQLDTIAVLTNATPQSEAKRIDRKIRLKENFKAFYTRMIPQSIKNLLISQAPNSFFHDIDENPKDGKKNFS